MCWSHSSTVGHQEGGVREGHWGSHRGRAAAGSGLGFLSCLPCPLWGSPLSFGFLPHWINVCSSPETKILPLRQVWAAGIAEGHRAGSGSQL